MIARLTSARLGSFAAAAAVAILLGAAGGALAGHHQDNGKSNTNSVPLHGPNSTHNPIVRHPPHQPGTIHDPIVKTGSKRHCVARGTVVHDHRNGRECSYVAGDSRSYNQYLQCEGIHHGGATPWC